MTYIPKTVKNLIAKPNPKRIHKVSDKVSSNPCSFNGSQGIFTGYPKAVPVYYYNFKYVSSLGLAGSYSIIPQ